MVAVDGVRRSVCWVRGREWRRDAPSSSRGRITGQLEPDTVPTPNRGLEELAEDESGMQEEVCVCLWK